MANDDVAAEEVTTPELLDAHWRARATELHTAMPARVESYDADRQTVKCTPMLQVHMPDGSGNLIPQPLPQLDDVPVSFPRCKKFTMTFPLEKGDFVLLVFCMKNIGAWRGTGDASDPGDTGTHTLDGAVAIPGLYDDANPSGSADSANMVIGSEQDGNSRIEIKPTGGMNLGAGATKGVARAGDDLSASAALAAWAAAVEAGIPTNTPPATTFATAAGIAGGLGTVHGASANIKAVD